MSNILRPIRISVKPRWQRLEHEQRAVRRAVIWPDMQCGFKLEAGGTLTPTHDRRAIDVALQITRHVIPNDVVMLGDNLDLPDWSTHFVRSPEFYWTTQPAAVELAYTLAQIRAISARMTIAYIEGNHEKRLQAAIEANLLAVHGLRPADDLEGEPLLSVPRLLGLDGLGVDYFGPYPGGEYWLNDHLRCCHGEEARTGSGRTVRSTVNELLHSEIQGHVHRVESAFKTLWHRTGSETYAAFSPGTLAALTPGLVPASKWRNNWQQGVAVVEYEPGRGTYHVDLVHIHNGRALYDGRVFVSRPEREMVDDVESATGFKFKAA